MKIKSICTKGISILLSTMMVASFIPVAVYADNDPDNNYFEEGLDNKYGDPETGKTDKAVYVVAENYDVGVEGGDIECNIEIGEEDRGGLTVRAYAEYDPETEEPVEGGAKYTATVTTGNITNTDEEGVGASIRSEDGGTADVIINGDVRSSYDGIYAEADMGGKTNVFISGDVVGTEGVGIYADADYYEFFGDEYGTVNVYVEGTITGKEIGVQINENGSENITITAWTITPVEIDGKKAVAGYWIYDGEDDEEETFVQDTEFEKKINYIIKLEQPAEGATLSAVDKANEGDEVKLTVDLQDGYDITGAFNGLGEKVPLEMGADGKYYVVVPKGGGVYLSVTVGKKTKIRNPQPTNGESSNNNTENSASLCASIAQMILNAAPGATVTANILSGLSLCKAVVDALEARPDVTLIVNYAYNNGIYSATIPPRTSDLTQYKNAAGGIDFETLTTNFNGKQIY